MVVPGETKAPSAAELAALPRPCSPPLGTHKTDPAEFRCELRPPQEVPAAMAARTAVGMGLIWNGTLEILDLSDVKRHSAAGGASVQFGSLGAGVTLEVTAGIVPVAHESGLPMHHWYAYVDASVHVPGEPLCGACARIAPYLGAWEADVPDEELDPDCTPLQGDSVETCVSLAVSGVYLKRGRTASPPANRQTMDFTDLDARDTWCADAGSEVTVTVIGSGVDLCVSGSLGLQEGQEVEIGANFGLGIGLALNCAPSPNTVYARVSDIRWGDTPVGGDAVDLYNTGDTGYVPNATVAPGWSRVQNTGNCYHVRAGNTIEIEHLQGTYGSGSVGAQLLAPTVLTAIARDGMMDTGGPGYDVQYTSNFIRYVQDPNTGHHSPEAVPFVSEYSCLQAYLSWLFEHEWRKLSSNAIQARVTEAWREANGEDVGGDLETTNDRRCGLCLRPRNATRCDGPPWWQAGIGIGHLASLEINDTYGLPSRAGPWEAGPGVTVAPGDNDLWTVTAGASAPAVSRDLKTRYWLRMERLADHLDDPEAEHHPDWPIMLKANLPLEQTQDDPDWWNPEAGGIAGEDIFNWANYRYLRVQLRAPRPAVARLRVDYSVPSVSDPCYTDFSHRFGAEGQWSYTRTRHTLTFDLPVKQGDNDLLVDFVLNHEAVMPVGAARLQVVDRLTFELPPNPGESDEQWELGGLQLVLDPGEGQRPEPKRHLWMRYKPSWAWIGSAWLGYGAVVDGKDALEIDYGYGQTGPERKLLYIQRREHSPDYQGEPTRLDYAKSLGRWCTELNWQEGFECTRPDPPPEQQAQNQDADEAQVDSSFYWWDLEQSNEDPGADPYLALCCGTYQIAAGVPYEVYFYKYPRGTVHGLAADPEHIQCFRETEGLLSLYESVAGGPWEFVEALDTDEHGRFRATPLREKGRSYLVDGGAGQVADLAVSNREYTPAHPGCGSFRPVEPCVAEGYLTDLHLSFVSEGMIYYRRRPTVCSAWLSPLALHRGHYPCLTVLPGNEVVLSYEVEGTVRWLKSVDGGESFGSVGAVIEGSYPVSCEVNGVQYLVTYQSGVGQVIRRSQDYFSTLLGYGSATSALVAPESSTNAERVGLLKMDSSGRVLWCAVPTGGQVAHYRSHDDGETWVRL